MPGLFIKPEVYGIVWMDKRQNICLMFCVKKYILKMDNRELKPQENQVAMRDLTCCASVRYNKSIHKIKE